MPHMSSCDFMTSRYSWTMISVTTVSDHSLLQRSMSAPRALISVSRSAGTHHQDPTPVHAMLDTLWPMIDRDVQVRALLAILGLLRIVIYISRY